MLEGSTSPGRRTRAFRPLWPGASRRDKRPSADELESLVLREVCEVLDVQRRQPKCANETTGGDPCVVHWAWSAAELSVRLQLTPTPGNPLAVGQHDHSREETVQRGKPLGSSASNERPLGQLAQRHECDGDRGAGEPRGDRIGKLMLQTARRDVCVEFLADLYASRRPTRRCLALPARRPMRSAARPCVAPAPRSTPRRRTTPVRAPRLLSSAVTSSRPNRPTRDWVVTDRVTVAKTRTLVRNGTDPGYDRHRRVLHGTADGRLGVGCTRVVAHRASQGGSSSGSPSPLPGRPVRSGSPRSTRWCGSRRSPASSGWRGVRSIRCRKDGRRPSTAGATSSIALRSTHWSPTPTSWCTSRT